MSIDLAGMVAYLRENPDESWNPLYDAVEELASTTRQDPFTNSIGMEMLWIPPGRFLMGAPKADKKAYTWERAQHEVVLTKGFHLGKYPVTRRQFAEYATATNSPQTQWRNPGFKQKIDHPVVFVSWDEARKFCAWLSEKEGCEYRLPTNAEWEYACWAGTKPRTFGVKALAKLAWHSENSGRKTHAVGELEPNAWGLYDMLGNVWEWCLDAWSEGYDASKVIDPIGVFETPNRVFRGGSWFDDPKGSRPSYRYFNTTTWERDDLGFRVARSGG